MRETYTKIYYPINPDADPEDTKYIGFDDGGEHDYKDLPEDYVRVEVEQYSPPGAKPKTGKAAILANIKDVKRALGYDV